MYIEGSAHRRGDIMDLYTALNDTLSTYSNATGIALSLINTEGRIVASFGSKYSYCMLLREAIGFNEPCLESERRACMQAYELGESYIFTCPGELVLFSVPVTRNGSYAGGVIAGPVTLDYPDLSLVDGVMKKYDIELNYRSRLFNSLSTIPLTETARIRHLSRLLFILVNNLLSGDNFAINQQSQKSLQQSQIGEYIQVMKHDTSSVSDLHILQEQLILAVIAGDSVQAKVLLNTMLGMIFFNVGGNIDMIRAKAIELVALVSLAVMESRNDEDIPKLTDTNFKILSTKSNFTDLSYSVMQAINSYIEPVLSNVSQSHCAIINKSISYISRHYNNDITLKSVSQDVGINSAYFSSLFKKEVGICFTEYVLKLRTEHAKQLLKVTNMPIVDIAAELGFDSQSYFSSVFKKHIGMTPRQYRYSIPKNDVHITAQDM